MAVNDKGTILAAADDSGQIAILDLQSGKLVKMLTGGHSSIASTVAFREHSPWEVLSGGLDKQIIRWNFSSGKPMKRWRLGEPCLLRTSAATKRLDFNKF